ncbi:MAG: exo-beta-N-acetylmuramidase NamZ family protein [Candidatus Longimicrobiales bacterium M2_2A_002]
MTHTERKVSGRAAARQSVGQRCDRRRLALRAALAAGLLGAGLLLSACGPGGSADAPAAERDAAAAVDAPAADRVATAVPPAGPAVTLGVDVLLRDSIGLLDGRRVGLITNHTGVSWDAGTGKPPVSTIDRLHLHDAVDLVALFSPEHGIRGDVDRPVDSSVDDVTGLPIHSLYGDTRKPTPAMLEGVDALVFDIQDIGTRYYSYVWTMTLAMEAAAEHGLRFVVLDRPNPIGGTLVQGNVRPGYMPVAYYEAAMRHGLTAGELARYVNGEYDLGVDLHVVAMEGWTRSMWWEDTGIPWRPPSPNMPSVESATHYPGTCLLEGTNLSVGRGTPEAFRLWGAPWLDADAVVATLRAHEFPGVAFEVVTFTPDGPTDGKYGGETVHGIRQTVTDRSAYDPVPVTIAALLEITRLHTDAFRWRDDWFDGLAGGPRLREQIQAGTALDEITAPWPDQRAVFRATVTPYLLYD